MASINENILIRDNEGLSVEFCNITFTEAATVSYLTVQFNFLECLTMGATAKGDGFAVTCVEITEDDLEKALKKYLEERFHGSVISFRWMWEYFRDYNVA